jgi:uncharacterized protein (TIGR02246 family)
MFHFWRLCFILACLSPAALAQEPRPLADNPTPAYPERARYGLITGDVRFRAYVTEEGTVQGVEITRVPAPDMGFEAAVVPVVQKWRFEPARRGSRAIAQWFEGSVRFSLKPEDEEPIYASAERAAVAWNRGDAQVLASLFADAAHMHTVTEDPALGPYQIRLRFAELLSTTLKGTHLTLSVDMIRFFERDRAEVEYTYQLTGGVENIGRIGTTFTQRDGLWLIDHARLIEGASVLWDTDPVVEYRPPDPPTPAEARQNNVTGRVVMEILVRRDGSTEVVRVLEAVPHGCTEAAIESAKQWRWKPALRNGEPIEATGTIWMSFGEKDHSF